MLDDDVFDKLAYFGKSVKEIFFCSIPDFDFLEALSEGGDAIFYFPTDKVYSCLNDEHAKYRIGSANFETDIFIDSEYLYQYPDMVDLVLTCRNREVESLDDRDLKDMFFAIVDLGKLQKVTFDVCVMKELPIEQIKKAFRFSGLEVQFITKKSGQKKKIERRRRL